MCGELHSGTWGSPRSGGAGGVARLSILTTNKKRGQPLSDCPLRIGKKRAR